MKRLRTKLTYANVVATLALFLVLGGGAAFAAANLPKNSVGPRQLKRGAVTPAKLTPAAKSTLVGPEGRTGPGGPAGPQGIAGPEGDQGPAATALWAEVGALGAVLKGSGVTSAKKLSGGEGRYEVNFNQSVLACTYQATLTEEEEFGFVILEPRIEDPDGVYVELADTTGSATHESFDLAVLC